MHLTTALTGESTVGALADRLYANLTPASRKLALAALIRANPHLGQAGKLAPGMVVRVPEVPELTVKAAQAGINPVKDVKKTLSNAVGAYQKRLAQAIDVAKKDVSDQVALLKTRDVTAAGARSPDATQLATNLTTSLA